jgi:hypothetical protein
LCRALHHLHQLLLPLLRPPQRRRRRLVVWSSFLARLCSQYYHSLTQAALPTCAVPVGCSDAAQLRQRRKRWANRRLFPACVLTEGRCGGCM